MAEWLIALVLKTSDLRVQGFESSLLRCISNKLLKFLFELTIIYVSLEENMKDEILQLRDEGCTYEQIKQKLGCSLSTIAYYCGKGQKQKCLERVYRQAFLRSLRNKVRFFQKDQPKTFTHKEVLDKFGDETTCYLTGRPLRLRESQSYNFDHKVPYSRGGGCTMDNLGMACREANWAKSNLTVDEFLGLCKEVLEHNGYNVERKS